MYKIVFLFGLALHGASALPSDSIADKSLVRDYNEAGNRQFPFMASLQRLHEAVPRRAHVCGGVLVSLQHVLTAASCLHETVIGTVQPIEVNRYRVFAGDRNINNILDPSRFRLIANYTIHPGFYGSPSHFNDIGIITLTSPFVSSNTLQPLSLPTQYHKPQESSSSCTVSGWGDMSGVTFNPNLKFVNKVLLTQPDCTTQYGQLFDYPAVTSTMLCAAPTEDMISGCQGDVGNPLVCNGHLVGLLFHTNRCAVSTDPELYTRVSNYTTWIEEVTGLSSSSTFQPSVAFVFIFAIAHIVTSKFNY